MRGAFVFCLLFAVSCASVPESRFYTLAQSGGVEVASMRSDLVIGIEDDRPYDDDRLVYRKGPHELAFYHYHQWVGIPPRMIRDRLLEELRAWGRFSKVMGLPGQEEPDWVVSGRILAFEEVDHPDRWDARVEVFLAVDRMGPQGDRLPVLARVYRIEETAQKRHPSAVAAALSRALDALFEEFREELEQALRS